MKLFSVGDQQRAEDGPGRCDLEPSQGQLGRSDTPDTERRGRGVHLRESAPRGVHSRGLSRQLACRKGPSQKLGYNLKL